MNNIDKAKIILKGLEDYIQVDSAFEEFYLKGILKGLQEIDGKLKEQKHEGLNQELSGE